MISTCVLALLVTSSVIQARERLTPTRHEVALPTLERSKKG